MATVAEMCGMRVKEGDLGIEIETETLQAYNIPALKGWVVKPDGSLRNFGQEYISREPIKIDNLEEHLKVWKDGLGVIHARMNPDSVSTSVHVHFNVQGMTPLQVLNYYLCGVLFENVLSKFAGPDREGNLFCLRTVDAENLFHSVKEKVKGVRNEFDLLNAFNPRGVDKLYTNIHTIPITSLGTIEWRVMRGTTDPKEIELWVKTLYNIREFSKLFKTPPDILAFLKEFGAVGAMREAFGDNFEKFYFNGCEKQITRNYIYIAEMATCRKDWEIKAWVPQARREHIPFVAPGRRVGVDENNNAAIVWDEEFEEVDL